MTAPRHEWPLHMSRRVRITGRLRMTSALHVGGGVGTTSMTDAGVVRHADGRPYIPGSSMKGVLRSHLERMSQNETLADHGATSCLLYAPETDKNGDTRVDWTPTAPDCPTPGWVDDGKDSTSATEADFASLCPTCTLFGSPILAGKIRVPDLEVDEATYGGGVEIRDGVGIDRDRGRAVDKVKFDYEVIPSDTVFDFQLSVDSPDTVELGLIAVAIREMQRGYLAVGGKTTRGMGHCTLESVAIEDTAFNNTEQLSAYLLQRANEEANQLDDPEAFLDQCIEELLTGSDTSA